MQRRVQGRVPKYTRPQQPGWFDNQRATKTGQGKPIQNGRKRHGELKSPARLVSIEDSLFCQDIGAESGEEAEVGHDIDEYVLL